MCFIILIVKKMRSVVVHNREFLQRMEMGGKTEWVPPSDSQLLIKKINNVFVVLDNTLACGTKSRWIEKYVEEQAALVDVFVMTANAFGHASMALAQAVQQYNKKRDILGTKRVLIICNSRYQYLNPPYIRTAWKLGARIEWSNDPEKRASQVTTSNSRSKQLPKGAGVQSVRNGLKILAESIVKQYGIFDTFFYTAGSGVIGESVQKGNIAHEYYAILVNYENYMPELLGFHKIIHHQPLSKLVNRRNSPPFSSTANFDAKGWQYARDYATLHPEKRVLFWNVC